MAVAMVEHSATDGRKPLSHPLNPSRSPNLPLTLYLALGLFGHATLLRDYSRDKPTKRGWVRFRLHLVGSIGSRMFPKSDVCLRPEKDCIWGYLC